MTVPYQILRSSRKTIAIQIKPDGQVVVRCPDRMCLEDIRGFVDSKTHWIQKHLAKLEQQKADPLTVEEIDCLREKTKMLVTERVKFYAPMVGVTYNRITVRVQRTRWGSCSSQGNLNFNCLLAMVPADVLDYVVVHELCHRKEMNHSAQFWTAVERVLPDYRLCKKWLKENGARLIAGI